MPRVIGHSSGTPPDPTLGVQIQREGAHLRVPLFNAPLEGAGTRRYLDGPCICIWAVLASGTPRGVPLD